MSATEDAHSPAAPTPHGRRARASLAGWAWAGALAGVIAAWLAFRSASFLPSLPRFECRVTDAAGHGFEVAGPSAPLTRARAVAAAGSADPEAEAARSRMRARAAELRGAAPGPLSQLTPAAECAALLRARAELARTLAGPRDPAAEDPAGAPLSNELADADRGLENAALAGDPAGLRTAMRDAEAAEDRWLSSFETARRRYEIWLARELDRGSQFMIAAEDLEALETPYQRDLVAQWQPQFMLELEAGALATLASMPGPGTVSTVRPRSITWAVGIAIGALAGALLALLLAAVIRRMSETRARSKARPRAAPARSAPPLAAPEPRRVPLAAPAAHASEAALVANLEGVLSSGSARAVASDRAAAPDRAPATASRSSAPHRGHGARAVAPGPLLAPAVGAAWLHLVSAESAELVARVAGEVATPLVARGQRVLIVEGGQRLRLHEGFGCAPRWGVGECLSGELPLLGTVQRAGVRDLYLLAAGSYPGRGSCAQLARLLDEARRHFSSVVVALDPRVPEEFRALAEHREAEAWWPHRSGRLPRAALSFGERVGLPVTPFVLPPRSEHWLEALEKRIEALRAVLAPTRAESLEPLELATAGGARATMPPSSAARATSVRPTGGRPMARERASAPRESAADDPSNPTVHRPANDADERARERLRFLMWMRQVRAERRKRTMTPVA